MRKIGLLWLIVMFFGFESVGQPQVSNITISPDLKINWFDPYTLNATVDPNGATINKVTFLVRPQSVSNAVLNWDYLTSGAAVPNPNVPLSLEASASGGNGFTYTSMRPDDIYPEIQFIPEISSTPSNSRFNRSNYHLLNFSNPFPLVANTSFFIEIYATPDNTPPYSLDLQVYLVGKGFDFSAFQSGGVLSNEAWQDHSSVELVGTINRSTSYHHIHNANSMHFLVPLATNVDGTIGSKTVDISGDFWIILYNSAQQPTRGWDLKYHTGENNSTWYMGDGTSFLVQTGRPDVHVHFAREQSATIADNMEVKVKVDYNGVSSFTSAATYFSFGELPNLPPNASSFTAPDAGTYSGNMTISWNPATDPNNDPLTYNVELLDYATQSLVYAAFTGLTGSSVSFNTLLVPNGDYDIMVEACDAQYCTPFYWTSNQEENAKVTINNAVWVGGSSGYETIWAYATNWSPESIPNENSSVSIPTGLTYYPVVSGLVALNNLHIATGALLTIAESGSLTIDGSLSSAAGSSGITIKSSASGTGSLIQSTANVPATVERYIPGWTVYEGAMHGWHFLSSPVNGQAISAFHTAGSGNDFYKWDEVVSDYPWINRTVSGGGLSGSFETNFVTGRGYLIANSITSTPSFTGNLQVADVPVGSLVKTVGSHLYHGWHLLGNPFASALSWNTVGGDWNLINVNANCQIWNEANASYTVILPDNIIPAMNGFMVYTDGIAANPGSLTIPAAARTHSSQQWYKKDSPGVGHIKLIARDPAGQTAQASVIRFDAEAPGGICMKRDSYFLEGFAPLFYSIREDKRLALNTLPEMRPDLIIPMGFRKNASKAFLLELSETIEGASVYLFDKMMQTEHLLTMEHPYTFEAEAGDDPLRFEIRFSSVNDATNTVNRNLHEASKVYVTGNILHVQFGKTQSGRLEIYDLSGRLMLQQTMGETLEYVQPLHLQSGVYLVRVTGKGFSKTEKVIVE